MSITVKLSDELINDARRYGNVYSRSVPKQIEYWSRIGKIAEENPDLSYEFIKDLLLAKQEVNQNLVTKYNLSLPKN
ncbi:MAG: ParD-like family protein [Pseudomonadota bacterium]